MNGKWRALVAGLALALVAAACGDAGTSTPPPDTAPSTPTPSTAPPTTVVPSTRPPTTAELVRAQVPRATTTDVTVAEIAALVEGNTAFALELFRRAADDEDGNLLVSPYSVAAALTMTYAGARGDTAAEMREAVHLALADDRLHTARNQLDLLLTAKPELPPDDDREPFAIEVANSLWGQRGYPFLAEFLTLLAAEYDAGMNLVDFAGAAEDARIAINGWVEDRTNGRIVDLIPEGIIDDLTTLVLVNAIWFKANWAEPFDPARTADGPFTTGAGDKVTVPLMRGSVRTGFVAGDGYAAVRLPYAGDAAMVLIVPDAGRFDDLAAGLDAATFAAIRAGLSEHMVDLAMPRFEFRSELLLQPVLEDLGIVTAFQEPRGDGGADFTGMTEVRELYIQEVVHQAFIAVDEEGTEAAAATAVVMGRTSAPTPAELTVDRPFLFLIEHGSTGEILFLGRVLDPSA